MAVKVERQIKATSFKPSFMPKIESSKLSEKFDVSDKGKGVLGALKKEVDSKLERVKKDEIKCFKCQGRGHYKSECPNGRVMTS